jgi:multidrug efflux pump subunit AcrB
MNILAARNEQAASQEMQDAQDMAGQILNAAERDVVLETINEAKETIDERRDESEEKAEEAEEKKAETDAADAKTKEERDNENIVKGESESDALELNQKLNSQSTDNVAEAQKQIAQIMKQNNLINEDIKGIDIDLNF